MSRIMMLVSAEGATLAETRVPESGTQAAQAAESQLREEALISGFTDEEVKTARLVTVNDFSG